MKNYLTIFVLLLAYRASFGQEPVTADSTSASIDLQMEKLVTSPVFYLKTQNDSCILLAKQQIRIIEEKWVDKIEVSTEDATRKEYGYVGKETLIFITLKKNGEKKFQEVSGLRL